METYKLTLQEFRDIFNSLVSDYIEAGSDPSEGGGQMVVTVSEAGTKVSFTTGHNFTQHLSDTLRVLF